MVVLDRKILWGGLSILIALVFFLFYGFSLFISSGILIFAYISMILVDNFGKNVPIKELMSFIVFLQLFISPLIVYEYFNNEANFTMYVPQEVYMAYALPALYFFCSGLNIPLSRVDIASKLKQLQFNANGQKVGIRFIVAGLIASLIIDFVPPSVKFIFYLIQILRFVGVFILVMSKSRYKWISIIIVFGEYVINTIERGVFYDLFVSLGFLYIFLEVKWQSTFLRKMLILTSGIMLIYFIQTIKGTYRDQAWSEDLQEDKTELFIDIAADKLTEKESFKETSNFDRFISRLNTAWIISKVMEHTPRREPFTNGELLKEDLINVLLPRFLFPDKSATGGIQNQSKFTRFTGRRLIGGTTMRIGAFADAYVNFGIIGGWLSLFFLGLLFNILLAILYRMAQSQSIYILWIPFIFAYAIRMSDFQVILNYTFKSFIFVIILSYFFLNRRKLEVLE